MMQSGEECNSLLLFCSCSHLAAVRSAKDYGTYSNFASSKDDKVQLA